jgi:glycosyltransferase involved in cell wall biosynthesis
MTLSDRDVVVVSTSNWYEPPRIRHQVARQMARFTRVLFVETPADWRAASRETIEEVTPNLIRVALGNPHRVPRRLHFYLDPLRALLYRRHLSDTRRVMRSEPKPVLINFNFDFAPWMRSDAFGAAIYYCNDEFTTWAPHALARRRIESMERATASAADRCLTVSTPLTDKLLRWNPRTKTLLPGHEFAERRPAPRREGPIRVAFMGYLNSRLDADWFARVLECEDMQLHLIGPAQDAGETLTRVINDPRAVKYGTKVGEEMQNILLDADVLVLPYRPTPDSGMLAATAPNKLFTYLAVAKPIVTSDLPALVSLGDGVLYRARSADEFVAAIRRAFAEDGDAFRERRLGIARENTWNSRGDQLRSMIEQDLLRRSEERR